MVRCFGTLSITTNGFESHPAPFWQHQPAYEHVEDEDYHDRTTDFIPFTLKT